jgi:DNA-binding XRE family transcriptional regulator
MPPSLALEFRIAQTFGLTVDEVFRYEGENQCKRSDEREIAADR